MRRSRDKLLNGSGSSRASSIERADNDSPDQQHDSRQRTDNDRNDQQHQTERDDHDNRSNMYDNATTVSKPIAIH